MEIIGDDVEYLNSLQRSTIWYINNNHPLYGYLRPRYSNKSLSARSAANFSYFSLSSLSFFSLANYKFVYLVATPISVFLEAKLSCNIPRNLFISKVYYAYAYSSAFS